MSVKEIQDCIGIALLCSGDWCRKCHFLNQSGSEIRQWKTSFHFLNTFQQHIFHTFSKMGKLLDKFPSFFFQELRFLFQLLSITYLWYVIEIVLQKVKWHFFFFSFKTTGKNRFWPCFANTKNFMKQQVKPLLFTGLFFIIKRQGGGKAKGTYNSLP